MELTSGWTARAACALQAALRLSNESFAAQLGIGVRTVASWHQKPTLRPQSEMQQILDTKLEQASAAAKARFATLVADQPPTRSADAGSDPDDGTAEAERGLGANPSVATALRVAIAVVVKDSDVLVVCRRADDGGGISWQFPAGMVKPGVSPETVAIRETLNETGVHCSVVHQLGSRIHPITNVFCHYLLCEYLAGDAQNLDIIENVSVVWVDRKILPRFISPDRIFPPVLEALEAVRDSADS
jgi:8-oxo-dGTP diphosphatase